MSTANKVDMQLAFIRADAVDVANAYGKDNLVKHTFADVVDLGVAIPAGRLRGEGGDERGRSDDQLKIGLEDADVEEQLRPDVVNFDVAATGVPSKRAA